MNVLKKAISLAVCIVMLSAMMIFPASAVDAVTMTPLTNHSNASYGVDSVTGANIFQIQMNDGSGNSTGYALYAANKFAGSGTTTLSTGTWLEAADSETRSGYKYDIDVIAGVNADFFTMNSGCTYKGYYVHNGVLAQASAGLSKATMLAFGSDGSIDIVESQLGFTTYLNGVEWSNVISHINKDFVDSAVGMGAQHGMFYYDYECGTKTDSLANYPGYELVFDKQDGSELVIGGSVKGKLVEIREDSYYSNVGRDQFVLYVQKSTSGAVYNDVKKKIENGSIALGAIVEIAVSELNTAASDITTKAYSIITSPYLFVENSTNMVTQEYVYSNFGWHWKNDKAMRTAIGIKADGSVLLVNYPGGSSGDTVLTGISVYDFADYMISLGCVTAIKMDGGGSTQMIVEGDDGTLGWKRSSVRGVANSLYVVKVSDKTTDTAIAAALDTAISDAEQALADAEITYDEANTDAISIALTYAYHVKANLKMEGDFIKATTLLKGALGGKSELDAAIAAAQGIKHTDYSEAAISMIQEEYINAAAVRADEDATSEEIKAATGKLLNLLSLKGDQELLVSDGAGYTVKGTIGADNYADTDGKELTDGTIATISNKWGPDWVGFATNQQTNKEGTDAYYEVTIDLGSVLTDLSKFKLYSEYDKGSGVSIPKRIELYVSDDNTEFTKAGELSLEGDEPVDGVSQDLVYSLSDTESLAGRYVRFRVFCGSGSWNFVTELEVYQAAKQLTAVDTLFISGLNTSIATDQTKLFTEGLDGGALTPGNANLNWTHNIIVKYDSDLGEFVIDSIKNFMSSNANNNLQVPAGGFVIAIHSDGGAEAAVNKAYALNYKAGDIVFANGLDLENDRLLPGTYVTFMALSDYAPELTVSDDKYKDGIVIEDGYVYNMPSGLTVSEIEELFEGDVTVNGTGTGSTLTYAGKTYTIIVCGDVTGDGKITATDYFEIKKHVLKVITLTDEAFTAAAIYNSSEIKATDYFLVKKHVLRVSDIYEEVSALTK